MSLRCLDCGDTGLVRLPAGGPYRLTVDCHCGAPRELSADEMAWAAMLARTAGERLRAAEMACVGGEDDERDEEGRAA